MNQHRIKLAMIGVSMLAAVAWSGQAIAEVTVDVGDVHVQVGEGPPPPDEVIVLTRGPMHEAFAQPVVFDEDEGFVIVDSPPPPLEEVIPDERPEGNQIVWIPGYWSWDSDRDDFIWVSGCWRAVPPSNSWVPGYWARTPGGYQWIAGFWTTADTEEIEYLPAPPESLEEGPQGDGSPDSIWVPGCWVRLHGGYAWRPGFWEQARPNWVWVPSHYVRTPRGWVYVDGYWDYALERRGVAFLPVYCPPSLYRRSDFRYSPDIVLDLNTVTFSLFISPHRRHYYFGDYYGHEYARAGYRPWYEARDHHDCYDPIFVHQRWRHRDDDRWVEHQRERYDRRRDDRERRPARTYKAMQARLAEMPEQDRKGQRLAMPMREVASEKDATPFKFEKLDKKRHDETADRDKEARAYRDKRSQWETPDSDEDRTRSERTSRRESREIEKKDAPPAEQPRADRDDADREQPVAQEAQPRKVRIPKPPVAAREPASDKEWMPPPRPKQPEPDPEVRQRREKNRSKDNDRSKDKDKDKDRDRSDRNERDSKRN